MTITIIEVLNDNNQWEWQGVFSGHEDEHARRKQCYEEHYGDNENWKENTRAIFSNLIN